MKNENQILGGDRTQEDKGNRRAITRDMQDALDEMECDHVYRERETAPLGVVCIKCGHFVGAWE